VAVVEREQDKAPVPEVREIMEELDILLQTMERVVVVVQVQLVEAPLLLLAEMVELELRLTSLEVL